MLSKASLRNHQLGKTYKQLDGAYLSFFFLKKHEIQTIMLKIIKIFLEQYPKYTRTKKYFLGDCENAMKYKI